MYISDFNTSTVCRLDETQDMSFSELAWQVVLMAVDTFGVDKIAPLVIGSTCLACRSVSNYLKKKRLVTSMQIKKDFHKEEALVFWNGEKKYMIDPASPDKYSILPGYKRCKTIVDDILKRSGLDVDVIVVEGNQDSHVRPRYYSRSLPRIIQMNKNLLDYDHQCAEGVLAHELWHASHDFKHTSQTPVQVCLQEEIDADTFALRYATNEGILGFRRFFIALQIASLWTLGMKSDVKDPTLRDSGAIDNPWHPPLSTRVRRCTNKLLANGFCFSFCEEERRAKALASRLFIQSGFASPKEYRAAFESYASTMQSKKGYTNEDRQHRFFTQYIEEYQPGLGSV